MAGHDKDQVIELSREELYQLVWTTPAKKLARKFKISDIALSKVCKKHGIPKSALGYLKSRNLQKCYGLRRKTSIIEKLYSNK